MEISIDDFGTGTPTGALWEALDMAFNYHVDPAQGIIRKVLSDGVADLTDKQRWIFVNKVIPTLTERCGYSGCQNKVLAGVKYCPTCALEWE